MKDTDRQLLIDLRKALLNLHKTLLDWERAAYEKIHGRTSPGNLLTALMNDAQFAWLRPLSAVIVAMDEWLDAREAEVDVADALADELRTLLVPDASGGAFQQRYAELLARNPTIILAHAAAIRALGR